MIVNPINILYCLECNMMFFSKSFSNVFLIMCRSCTIGCKHLFDNSRFQEVYIGQLWGRTYLPSGSCMNDHSFFCRVQWTSILSSYVGKGSATICISHNTETSRVRAYHGTFMGNIIYSDESVPIIATKGCCGELRIGVMS